MHKKLLFFTILILVISVISIRAAHTSNKSSFTKLYQGVADTNKTLQDYYTESKTLVPPPKPTTKTVTFLAVGDISLSRNIAQTIKIKNDPLYPFRGVDTLLQSTDFNFGNLETPFSLNDSFTPKNTLIFNAPKTNIIGLTTYNFEVLNLANNHAFDQGLTGLITTKEWLDKNNIKHMGTGETSIDTYTPTLIEKNGIRILFFGYSYASINDGGKATNPYVARIEQGMEDMKSKDTLRYWKKQLGADFIVVTMHAGTEYTATANSSQIAFAHTAIDAGADIVIGAHPHWVQNKEVYKNKTIYYSLGNFIFDQNWSKQTQQGLTLKITLKKNDSCTPYTNNSLSTEPIAACGNEIQGSSQASTIAVEEIPIEIKENCCPVEVAK